MSIYRKNKQKVEKESAKKNEIKKKNLKRFRDFDKIVNKKYAKIIMFKMDYGMHTLSP